MLLEFVKLAPQPFCSRQTLFRLSKLSNSLFAAPLFSCSYESPFPELLFFHIDLNPPGCVSPFAGHTYNPANPLFPITSLQTSHFHAITHSFAQRRTTIWPILNGFRTLSIATGVVPPARGNPSRSTSTSTACRGRTPQTCQHSATVLKSTRRHYEHL